MNNLDELISGLQLDPRFTVKLAGSTNQGFAGLATAWMQARVRVLQAMEKMETSPTPERMSALRAALQVEWEAAVEMWTDVNGFMEEIKGVLDDLKGNE